uniref:Secreted protein n=1 Tax=Octopus bimaculoides TaxID=37653 RepID=A0A0L8HBL8_OCTBM
MAMRMIMVMMIMVIINKAITESDIPDLVIQLPFTDLTFIIQFSEIPAAVIKWSVKPYPLPTLPSTYIYQLMRVLLL